MKLEAVVKKHGMVCHVELEFTSADKDGVHYFQMVKPRKITNKRFKWEPMKSMNPLQPLAEALIHLISLEDSKIGYLWKKVEDA
jgi:hypothetical protein